MKTAMKMKFNCAVIILYIISLNAFSQELRHVKGQKGIELNAGFTLKGQYAALGYSQYFAPKLYGKILLGYENAKVTDIKVGSEFLDLTLNYTLFNVSKVLYVNGTAGGTMHLDTYKNYEPAGTKFNYGLLLGAEAEIFLSPRFVLLINGRQSLLFGYHQNLAYGGVGLKYIF